MPSRAPDVRGDFQTPLELARAVWATVPVDGVAAVVEPTVGLGAFLAAAPRELLGAPWRCFELEREYVERTRSLAERLGATRARIEVADAFALDATDLADLDPSRPLVAIGNPPWVTSAAQAGARATNLPAKTNAGIGLRGLDALTGRANFDLAEAVLLRLLAALAGFADVRLAFLVKRSVALRLAERLIGVADELEFARVDARRWFGAAVDAGVLAARVLRPACAPVAHLAVRDELGGPVVRRASLTAGGAIVDVDRHARVARLEAETPVPWRQGIKHDLARVLELRPLPDGRMSNGYGDEVDVEREALVPLYKGSDIANARPPSRLFPLYQTDLGGPDARLAERWPRLARYLEAHASAFAARRSRIYRGKHPYALFGVGPYVGAPWKVAVCGLYRTARFVAIGPVDGAPPVVDDTCYLLPYPDERSARAVADHLNGPDPQELIASLTDLHAKRPFTKRVLARVAVPFTPLDCEAAAGQTTLALA